MFKKGNYSFKGSEIDRKFSHGNLKTIMSANLNEAWEKIQYMIMADVPKPKPEVERQPKPVAEQLIAGSPIPKIEQKPIEQPQHKLAESPPTEQKPAQPVSRNPIIGGIRLTDEQVGILRNDGYIFLENMEKKDGSGRFSRYVFADLDLKHAFYSTGKPDEFVKYGKYEMRLMDKRRLEKGYLTRAVVRWYGGGTARPYLWKAVDDTAENYKESFADPRIPKEVHEKNVAEFRKNVQQKHPPSKKKGRTPGH